MIGFQAPMCVCGHTSGDHRSAGTVWPHPPRYGVCLTSGCDCREFRETSDDVGVFLRARREALEDGVTYPVWRAA